MFVQKKNLAVASDLVASTPERGEDPQGQVAGAVHRVFPRPMDSVVDHQFGLCRSSDGLTKPATAHTARFFGTGAGRAEALVCMEELSAGRQALEGAPVAPGNERTLRELRNPVRRPPQLRAPLSEDLLTAQPEIPFQLDQGLLCEEFEERSTWSSRWPFRHDGRTFASSLGF